TVAQLDPPAPLSSGHFRPVRAWYPNEFLAGSYPLALPLTLPAGTYRLTLAFYDAPSGPTLPVHQPGQPDTPVLDLGPLTVTP
ncbi:MAG TPA: hypothetical protein VM536_14560, partial [Chloroflexia bacterium]|nr:hypothetical protein [Chloroflexia bacterium]